MLPAHAYWNRERDREWNAGKREKYDAHFGSLGARNTNKGMRCTNESTNKRMKCSISNRYYELCLHFGWRSPALYGCSIVSPFVDCMSQRENEKHNDSVELSYYWLCIHCSNAILCFIQCNWFTWLNEEFPHLLAVAIKYSISVLILEQW